MRAAVPLLILGLVATSLPAWAQGARQPAPPSNAIDDNRKEAALLADAFGIPQQIESVIRQAHAEMVRATIKASDLPEDDATRIVDDIMMPNFQARIQELVAELIEPYAQNFTISDLRALRAFYASPLGQKLLRVQPLAEAQGTQAGLAWGQRVFQDSVDRHVDELRARGLKF